MSMRPLSGVSFDRYFDKSVKGASMTPERYGLGYSVRFAVSVLISLLLLAASASIAADRGLPGSPDTAERYDRMLKKVKAEGNLRVIVGLKTHAGQDDGRTPRKNMKGQLLEITDVQGALLSSIPIADESRVSRFRHIPFLALGLDEAVLQRVMNHPLVSSIEEDTLHRPLLLRHTTSLIGAGIGEASQYTGAGRTIVILDTGVDNLHPYLSGKIVDEACFSSKDLNFGVVSLCPNGQISQSGFGSGTYCPASFSDCYHGTHVAGIAAGRIIPFSDGSSIRGVAPGADIISIQIYSAIFDASACIQMGAPSPCVLTYSSDILRALDHVHDLRNSYPIASVNISAGGGLYTEPCDAFSPSIKAAVDQLRSAGIATVVAAGNDGSADGLSDPACVSSVVSVGATQHDGFHGIPEHVAPYSNSAPFLSLLAPGGCSDCDDLSLFGILSSIPFEWGSYWAYSAGTSSAAPHVAGAWALLKQKKPSASVDEILTALQLTGIPVRDPKNGMIKPRIQVDAALASLSSNRCAAVLNENFLLHNPIILFNGQAYQADFQYAGTGLSFTLAAAGLVSDTGPYSTCLPSTISNDYKIHMPEVIFNGISYWADFLYAGGTTFTLTGAGQN